MDHVIKNYQKLNMVTSDMSQLVKCRKHPPHCSIQQATTPTTSSTLTTYCYLSTAELQPQSDLGLHGAQAASQASPGLAPQCHILKAAKAGLQSWNFIMIE